MAVHNFSDLYQHFGHKVVVITYGGSGNVSPLCVAIECEDCYEVLVDFDRSDDEVDYKD